LASVSLASASLAGASFEAASLASFGKNTIWDQLANHIKLIFLTSHFQTEHFSKLSIFYTQCEQLLSRQIETFKN
jgi:hypothetical protein